MTPPDQPEEAPSALSRLERALAGFGEPKPAPSVAEAEPEPEPEPDVAAAEPDEDEPADEEPVAEESVAEEPDEYEPEPEAGWAASRSSVLDIASAVAAVESLGAVQPEAGSSLAPPPLPPLPDRDTLLAGPTSDADAHVLAATAAGTSIGHILDDEGADDEEAEEPDTFEESSRFEPLDLRARIHEFASEGTEEPESEEEAEAEEVEEAEEAEEAEDVLPYFALDPTEAALADHAAAEAEGEAEPEAEPASWQRNLGDTTLPYFLVEDNLPEATDAVTMIEDLRAQIVRPPVETKPKDKEPKPPASIARTLAEIPVLLIVAAVIAFLVKTFLAQAYYIPSGSMIPQLQIDDRVVVSKLAYKAHDARRGDIIVFDDPRTGAAAAKTDEGLLRKVGEGIGIVQPSTDEFIKRVIGLPGETVEGKNGHVFINGHRLIEPYLKSTVITSDFPKVTVKPGRLWVMGDNRTGSADSRVFGQIKISTIVGRAVVKVWPFNHISFL